MTLPVRGVASVGTTLFVWGKEGFEGRKVNVSALRITLYDAKKFF